LNKTIAKPATRDLLKDQAYRELMRLIQTGVIAPDSAVSERQLVERLGMSKTPIRAALEILEAEGLVTVSPQRGILIRELTAREIGELFDVRIAIEPYIASRLASRSISNEQTERLKKNLAQQRIAAKKEDARAATRLDIEFHRMLGDFFDNNEMSTWLEKCFNKLQRSVLRINSLVPGRLQKSTDDHKSIVDAIVAGKNELAADRMISHLRYGSRFLMGIYDEHEEA
jgi:DNA-binding GntR family transcriptional regulator